MCLLVYRYHINNNRKEKEVYKIKKYREIVFNALEKMGNMLH